MAKLLTDAQTADDTAPQRAPDKRHQSGALLFQQSKSGPGTRHELKDFFKKK
jgi:hypothetical protein